jgi:hypothetical protein
MCMFVVAVLVAAVVLGAVFHLAWPSAIVLGVVVILGMSVWETVSRPWKIRQAFEGERNRLIHSGWSEEKATMAARAYVQQKFNLQ